MKLRGSQSLSKECNNAKYSTFRYKVQDNHEQIFEGEFLHALSGCF